MSGKIWKAQGSGRLGSAGAFVNVFKGGTKAQIVASGFFEPVAVSGFKAVWAKGSNNLLGGGNVS